MENIRYTVNDNTIELGYAGSQYMLDSYTGITEVSLVPTTHNGYSQNGLFMDNIRYDARYINIYFMVFTNTMEETYQQRQYLASLFNPMAGMGELTYTNDYTSKSIKCYPITPLAIVEKSANLMTYHIELIAPNPFWYDTDETAIKLEGFTGGLTFPLKFEGDGVIFAQKGSIADIDIVGDIPSPIRAEFIGVAQNPTLTKENTGEYIKVNTTMAEGEKLVVNTEYANKSVKLVTGDEAVSAFNYLDTGSTFFSLNSGRNHITFTATSGTPAIYLYWRNYYSAI